MLRCVGVVVVTQAAHSLLSLSRTFNGKTVLFLFVLFFFCLALAPAVDTTRVEILEADPDVAGSDYINANYIRVRLLSLIARFCAMTAAGKLLFDRRNKKM